MFLKVYNVELDDIKITFMDLNGRLLETEEKANLHCLLINRHDASLSTTKNENICQKIKIFVIREKPIQQIWKIILGNPTKARLDAVKIDSKRVINKSAEATGELIENKLLKKFNQKLCLIQIQNILK